MEIQGHRGCRGLMPENTIDGFIKAIDLGVNTLEMDVVISGDGQIIVSHEAFFNHEISTHPENIDITTLNEKDFNIFKMSRHEISRFDVGLKVHPRFPLQKKIRAVKPTLREVVESVSNYIQANNLQKINYNIEIKHDPSLDNIFNPKADLFTKMVFDEIQNLGIKQVTCIQSFDPECLNIIHAHDSQMVTALLVENKESFESNLKKLNFIPNIYSPNFKLADDALLKACRLKKIRLIPWTINDEKDIINQINLGVDGIISDFPDKVIEIYEGIKNTN